MRCLFTSAAVVALVALSGCAQGGTKSTSSVDNFAGDSKQVAKTVENFQAEATADNGTKICTALITAKLAKQIKAKNPQASCAASVTAAMKATDEAALTVTKVTIDAKNKDKATATVSAKTGDKSSKSYSFTLIRSGNSWQIASFG